MNKTKNNAIDAVHPLEKLVYLTTRMARFSVEVCKLEQAECEDNFNQALKNNRLMIGPRSLEYMARHAESNLKYAREKTANEERFLRDYTTIYHGVVEPPQSEGMAKALEDISKLNSVHAEVRNQVFEKFYADLLAEAGEYYEGLGIEEVEEDMNARGREDEYYR